MIQLHIKWKGTIKITRMFKKHIIVSFHKNTMQNILKPYAQKAK
jgi:hypothetical protein